MGPVRCGAVDVHDLQLTGLFSTSALASSSDGKLQNGDLRVSPGLHLIELFDQVGHAKDSEVPGFPDEHGVMALVLDDNVVVAALSVNIYAKEFSVGLMPSVRG